MYKKWIKRIFDFGFALLGLFVLSPILLVAIISISLKNNGNPFFFQFRPGKNGKIFKVIKLKTMNDKRDDNGILLPDAERLTSIGRFIRKTSLDEIPQLLNVLKGDMSLIGPRPLLVEYLSLYNENQKRRHEIRPGITGWAQVNGRNVLSWEQKFEYDVWYIDHLTFSLDIKILYLTIMKVLKREGINASGEATIPKFEGTSL